jgi:hypothetical protein
MNNPQKLLPLVATLCTLAFAAGQPPKLRLAEVQDIAPAGYRVDLTLDPAKDSFAGVIDIRVDVKKPAETIWLNAKKIAVEAASIASGGKTWQAKTIPGGDNFLGLQLDSALPVGGNQNPLYRKRPARRHLRRLSGGGRRQPLHLHAIREHRRARRFSLLRRAIVQGAVAAHATHPRAGQGRQQHSGLRNQRGRSDHLHV